jgi:hypothetical protein
MYTRCLSPPHLCTHTDVSLLSAVSAVHLPSYALLGNLELQNRQLESHSGLQVAQWLAACLTVAIFLATCLDVPSNKHATGCYQRLVTCPTVLILHSWVYFFILRKLGLFLGCSIQQATPFLCPPPTPCPGGGYISGAMVVCAVLHGWSSFSCVGYTPHEAYSTNMDIRYVNFHQNHTRCALRSGACASVCMA